MIEFLQSIADLFTVQTAFADAWSRYYNVFGTGTGTNFVNTLAIRAANLALKFITGGAVLAIMWGGLKLISSAGNEEGKESAKKILMFAVGGLLLAIMSRAVIDFTSGFVAGFA
jgi:hypothetical protein